MSPKKSFYLISISLKVQGRVESSAHFRKFRTFLSITFDRIIQGAILMILMSFERSRYPRYLSFRLWISIHRQLRAILNKLKPKNRFLSITWRNRLGIGFRSQQQKCWGHRSLSNDIKIVRIGWFYHKLCSKTSGKWILVLLSLTACSFRPVVICSRLVVLLP